MFVRVLAIVFHCPLHPHIYTFCLVALLLTAHLFAFGYAYHLSSAHSLLWTPSLVYLLFYTWAQVQLFCLFAHLTFVWLQQHLLLGFLVWISTNNDYRYSFSTCTCTIAHSPYLLTRDSVIIPLPHLPPFTHTCPCSTSSHSYLAPHSLKLSLALVALHLLAQITHSFTSTLLYLEIHSRSQTNHYLLLLF